MSAKNGSDDEEHAIPVATPVLDPENTYIQIIESVPWCVYIMYVCLTIVCVIFWAIWMHWWYNPTEVCAQWVSIA